MSNLVKYPARLPELAILIPVFNPGDKLRRSLEALSAMDCGDIVVVNDGGEEDLSYATGGYNLNVINIDLSGNSGITKALNAGLDYCLKNGYKYVARLDAGDIPINDRFNKQIKFLEDNPECSLVGCQVEVRDMDGKFEFFHINPTSSNKIRKAMRTRNVFYHCSVMFPMQVVKELGGYDENFLVAQDYEFFFRICSHYQTGLIDEVLVYDLYNPKGITYSRRPEQLRSKLRVQLKYFDPLQIRSYIGVLKSLMIIVLPDNFVWYAKKLIKNGLASRKRQASKAACG